MERKTFILMLFGVFILSSYSYSQEKVFPHSPEKLSSQKVNQSTLPNSCSITARESTTILAPKLKITQEVNQGLIFLHRQAEFKITVENKGTTVAHDVRLQNIIPKELDYVSSAPQGIYQPSSSEQRATLRWNLGDLVPGKKVTLKLSLRGEFVGTCTNTAKVRSEGKVYQTSTELRIRGISAMYLQSYDTEDPVEVGKRTTYYIEATNEGTSASGYSRLVNEIPEEMKFISAQGPAGYTVDYEKGIINFETVEVLKPGEKLLYKIVCEVISEGNSRGSAKNRAILYLDWGKPIIDEEGTSVYK